MWGLLPWTSKIEILCLFSKHIIFFFIRSTVFTSIIVLWNHLWTVNLGFQFVVLWTNLDNKPCRSKYNTWSITYISITISIIILLYCAFEMTITMRLKSSQQQVIKQEVKDSWHIWDITALLNWCYTLCVRGSGSPPYLYLYSINHMTSRRGPQSPYGRRPVPWCEQTLNLLTGSPPQSHVICIQLMLCSEHEGIRGALLWKDQSPPMRGSGPLP